MCRRVRGKGRATRRAGPGQGREGRGRRRARRGRHEWWDLGGAAARMAAPPASFSSPRRRWGVDGKEREGHLAGQRGRERSSLDCKRGGAVEVGWRRPSTTFRCADVANLPSNRACMYFLCVQIPRRPAASRWWPGAWRRWHRRGGRTRAGCQRWHELTPC